MARKFQIWAILLMVCAMGFTVAAQSTSQLSERIFVLKAQKTALPLILMASSALALPMALFSLCHTLDLSHKKLLPTANNQ